jgi:protein-disulfide isomerase
MSNRGAAIIQPKDVFIGDPNAPVTLLEFADYETPEAAVAHTVVEEILHTYEGKVKFSFRHFPLRHIHQKAQKGAEAAVAAVQEGKFWEMHQMLVANRRNLGTISLHSYAEKIGMTNKGFLNSLLNGKYAWSVQDDLDEGFRLGVNRTPAFFINGEKLAEPFSDESLKAKVVAAVDLLRKE